RGDRAGGRGGVQRRRRRRVLLTLRAVPLGAAESSAAPSVPRSARPERPAGGAPRARSAACRGSPPPRRPICPLPPRRGRLTFRPGLLGASRVGASPGHSDAEWLALVRSEVGARLSASRVRWDESIATSVVTGEGLPELRDALRRVAGDLVECPADDLFRLPIDRVFAVAGAGTVVTGSTWSGSVAVGDAVRLLPLGCER